ncbi:MAG TPA: glycosyltransferase family 9 protein [Vicinamibacterales bacterium]|nr:glycosyltransferase family 9 protein [Vicinamibacterales bacterium]
MRVDMMRRVDRWCGVPLCFLLTVWRRLAGERRAASSPRQILCIQTAEMGSLVLALPAVRHLERAHPGVVVHMLVFRTIAGAVPAIGLAPAERVIAIDPSSLFTIARDTLRFMGEARRRRIDTVVNLEMFARFGALLAYLSGAARRAGFHAFGHPGLYCGDLLTHRVIYNPHIHTAEALLTIARSLEEDPAHVPMGKLARRSLGEGGFPGGGGLSVSRMSSDATARDRMQTRLAAAAPAAVGRRLIVINPNASQLIPIRRWPIESYAALVARLLEDPKNACVLTGTADEQPDTRFIVDRVRSDRIVDLAGKTTIGDLLDLYNVADLLVTNDSGPAQIAALASVKILVFFGPETPALYRPLAEPERCRVLYSQYACSPCVTAFNQRKTDCTDNQCLKVIDVETVHRNALEMLVG